MDCSIAEHRHQIAALVDGNGRACLDGAPQRSTARAALDVDSPAPDELESVMLARAHPAT
jgi:hypothetical protein